MAKSLRKTGVAFGARHADKVHDFMVEAPKVLLSLPAGLGGETP